MEPWAQSALLSFLAASGLDLPETRNLMKGEAGTTVISVPHPDHLPKRIPIKNGVQASLGHELSQTKES